MTERQRHQDVLAINRAIAGAGDEAEILRLVVDRAAAITGATACVLLLAGEDGIARVVRSAGVPPEKEARLNVPLSEHLDEDLRDRLGVRAGDGFAGAPVIGKGGLRGILAVYREGSRAVDASADEEVLSAFADQAAIALDNVESQRRLREAEARSRSILAAMAEGVVMQDASGRIVQCNAAAERILGLSRDRLEGRTSTDPFRGSIHEDGKAFPSEHHPATVVLRTGTAVSGVIMGVQKPDGSLTWISINAEPVRAGPGSPPHAVVTSFADVTSLRRADAALRASEARFRALADEAPVGIYQTDAEGRTVYLNRAGQVITGRSRGEVLGEGWNASLHPGDRERVARELGAAIASGNVFEGEYRFVREDGTSALARGYATALRDGAGAITGYIGVVMDITAVKALETQLALASRLAAMGTLVAGVAHEVNNPLAATMAGQHMALEVIQAVRERLRATGPLDREEESRHLDAVIEDLADAEAGGKRIGQIVKDMSAFARHRSERKRLRLVDVIVRAMRWLPSGVGETASITVEDGCAPDVVAASGQIEQVVVNLLTNAARATKPGARGTIVVRVGPGSPGTARMDVTDLGVGIDPAIRNRIFDPFFTTRQVGEGRGMGLGLAISHTIVHGHGGTLAVESEVGKGSMFRMELPAAPAET